MRPSHRFAAAAALLFAMLLSLSTPATAASCSRNADCTGGQTCQTVLDLFFFQWKSCKNTLCNTDGDCRNGTLCLLGMCQVGCRNSNDCAAGRQCVNAACVGTGNPSPGSGKGFIEGEGRQCMPADGSKPPDWARDSHGKPLGACPTGTSCSSTGFCRRLET